MTPQKVLEVIEIYRKRLEGLGMEKVDFPHEHLLHSLEIGLCHCHGMLDKIAGFVKEGRMEKAFRWLGFVQGVFWSSRHYSLEDLKNHNRPPDSRDPSL